MARPLWIAVAWLVMTSCFAARPLLPLKFSFDAQSSEPGATAVAPDLSYDAERGFGFERTAAAGPSYFTVRVPHEGNYRVTIVLSAAAEAARTTIKAELRRLMVADAIVTAPAETKRVTFIVNTRTPRIRATPSPDPAATPAIAAGTVRLKAPRETTQEAWAWDDALTLEFSSRRTVRTVEIAPAEVPTIFLLGDSTVCDQSKEPYASWGQMLTRFFKPEIAIANHGESGETYRNSLGRRRLDKILSVMRPGDWLFMQFGHNDQKQIAAGTGGPFTTYQAELKRHVDAFRARGGNCVVVSPMERRAFDAAGHVKPSLADYAAAARQSAAALGVAFIDLNALSQELYAALGPDKSARAFAAPGSKVDNTHHNNYGSYELAKCIVAAIRTQHLPLAKFVVDDFGDFDPRQPDHPDTFAVPASGEATGQRPLGDEPNRN
jgi:lysophospholipase L1-like esterase